jgi:Family of unknown function (DUF5677)
VTSNNNNDAWLSFAEQEKGLCTDILAVIAPRATSNQALVIALLYARAYQSFEAATMRARAGLMNDARGTIRSCVESAIGIAATARDSAFVDRLIEADEARRLAWARITIDQPALHADLSAEQLKNMRDLVDTAARAGRKPRPINWSQVATDSGVLALYHTHYRFMSWHLHVGIESLNTFANTDASSQITGIRWEPDLAGLAQTISAACDALFWASAAVAEFFHLTDLGERVRSQHRAFAQLLGVASVAATAPIVQSTTAKRL